MTAINLNGLLPHSARRDPVRPGPRVKVEITSYGYGTAVRGHDRGLKRGKNIVVMHRDDVSSLEEKVETRHDLVDQAKQSHQELIRIHVENVTKSKLSDESVEALKAWAIKDHQDRQPTDLLPLQEVQKKAANTYPGSWQAEFTEITRRREGKARGRKPIASYKVIEELPPEMSPESLMVRDIVGNMAQPSIDVTELGNVIAKAIKDNTKSEGRSKGA